MAEFTAAYRGLRARAQRVTAQRRARLRRALASAGLGADAPVNVLHNALIAAQRGRPWRGVDTAALRHARHIERDLYLAEALVARWAARQVEKLACDS